MQRNTKLTRKNQSKSTAGFTLLEQIILVAIIGILSAIAIPSWIGFVDRLSLNIAQDQVYRAMQAAQSNAKRDKITWQVSFREVNQVVQLAVHPAESQQFMPLDVKWHDLGHNIRIDKQKNNKGISETTLYSSGRKKNSGLWRVQFNYHGNTNGQSGQITLITDINSKTKRCVYVSTLIGTLRMGKEHPKPNSNKKYCY